MNKKMADIDIDPFGEHDRTDSRTDETDENIPIPPVRGINLGTRMRGMGNVIRRRKPKN